MSASEEPKTRTRQDLEIEIEFAEGQIAEVPQNAINRLRDCFPDLETAGLHAMAIHHPDVKRERQAYLRRARRCRKQLAALG